jgi:hypothetical protein
MATNTPIAIIGMSCRFAGDVDSPEFYDYVSFVVLKKKRHRGRGTTSIPFPPTAAICEGWVQCLRVPQRTAVPIFDGRLADEFDEKDTDFVKR